MLSSATLRFISLAEQWNNQIFSLAEQCHAHELKIKIRPKKKYNLENEDDLKNEDDLENEDDLKNEDTVKNEDDLKNTKST